MTTPELHFVSLEYPGGWTETWAFPPGATAETLRSAAEFLLRLSHAADPSSDESRPDDAGAPPAARRDPEDGRPAEAPEDPPGQPESAAEGETPKRPRRTRARKAKE